MALTCRRVVTIFFRRTKTQLQKSHFTHRVLGIAHRIHRHAPLALGRALPGVRRARTARRCRVGADDRVGAAELVAIGGRRARGGVRKPVKNKFWTRPWPKPCEKIEFGRYMSRANTCWRVWTPINRPVLSQINDEYYLLRQRLSRCLQIQLVMNSLVQKNTIIRATYVVLHEQLQNPGQVQKDHKLMMKRRKR